MGSRKCLDERLRQLLGTKGRVNSHVFSNIYPARICSSELFVKKRPWAGRRRVTEASHVRCYGCRMACCARSSQLAVMALVLALSFALACSGSDFQSKSHLLGGRDASGDGGAQGSGSGGASASGGASGEGAGPSGTGGAVGSGGVSSSGGQGGSSAGGAPTSTIQLVTSYDRVCTNDGECVLVAEGDVCGCPGCHNAAIAGGAQAAWDADRKRIYCPLPSVPMVCPAFACVAMLPACVNGLCVARYRRDIDATNYDASCRANTDCNLIYTGEVCSSCRCGTAAVNASGYAEYQKDVAGVQCTPVPAACDCAARTSVSCKLPTTPDLGTCVVGP